jgi:hypothetical protein
MPRLSPTDETLRAQLIEKVEANCGCKGEQSKYPIITCRCGEKWEVRSLDEIECVCGHTIAPIDPTPFDMASL